MLLADALSIFWHPERLAQSLDPLCVSSGLSFPLHSSPGLPAREMKLLVTMTGCKDEQYLYTRRRTLSTSSSSLNGFVMYKSAPCRSPQDLSTGVLLLVNKIIGMCLLASRLLSLRHN